MTSEVGLHPVENTGRTHIDGRRRLPRVNASAPRPHTAPPTPARLGGIATIEDLCRRVAGVSEAYGCNSPHLHARAMDTAPKVQTT